MIEFKKNVDKILPYHRQQYRDYLGDEVIPLVKWHGVSFQLPGIYEGVDIGLMKFINVYEKWFEKVVSKLDNGTKWIVNHDDKDMKWLPNEENTLTPLRDLFKERNIPFAFKGAITFEKDDLLKFSKVLISYPYAIFGEKGALYKNLDISHGRIPFIIKISSHLNIDLLSTDKELLRKVVDENSLSIFILRQYRGTSL
jgi:hypothetical protein